MHIRDFTRKEISGWLLRVLKQGPLNLTTALYQPDYIH